MAIQRNSNQTLSLTPENPNVTPQLDMSVGTPQMGMAQPQQAPAQTQVQQPLNLSLDAYAETGMDMSLGGYEEPNVLQNVLGGFLTGALTESFEANSGVVAESYTDTLNNRIIFTDDNGDLMLPEMKTTAEWLGFSDEEWNAIEPSKQSVMISKKSKDEVLKFSNADPDSTSFVISELAGMIFGSPSSYVPGIRETKLATAMWGGTIGAADMGAYGLAHEGETSAGMVAMGAVVGGGAGYIAKKLSNTAKATSKRQVQQVDSLIKEKLANGDSINKAYMSTLKDVGMDEKGFKELLESSGQVPSKKASAYRERKGFDNLFEPVSERVKDMSPRLWMKLQDMYRKNMQVNRTYEMLVDNFVRRDMKKLGSTAEAGVARDLKLGLVLGDSKSVGSIIQKLPTQVAKSFASYTRAMDELWGMTSKARKQASTPLGGKIDTYMHRAVKDYKEIRKVLGKPELSRLDKILEKEATLAGAKLGDNQVNSIYSKFLSGYYDTKGIKATPSAAKARKLTADHFKANPKLLDAFHDPLEATHTYIRKTVEDAHQKQFLGKDLVHEFGDNLNDDLFSAVAAKEVKAGNMSTEQVDELKKVLDLLFIKGKKNPHRAIKVFKNLSYSTLLGNPISAITQVGDIFIAAAKYGLVDTVASIPQSLGKRGFSPKEMGMLESLMEEFVSDGMSNTLLRASLKYGGFSTVDALGKAVNMNASFRRAARLAKSDKGLTKLHAKWGRAFGDDFAELAKDLRTGNTQSEHVKAMVFAELADVQPITLFEMPAKYLEAPNGRVMYMLRTFQLKYMNLLRQHSYYAFKNGDRKGGIIAGAALASAFTMGGMTTDAAKNFILNRDVDVANSLVDNMFKMSGVTDRYSFDKVTASTDPAPKFIENLFPPVGLASPLLATVISASQGEVKDKNTRNMVKQIPVFGKVFENYVLGGREEYNAKRWAEGK